MFLMKAFGLDEASCPGAMGSSPQVSVALNSCSAAKHPGKKSRRDRVGWPGWPFSSCGEGLKVEAGSNKGLLFSHSVAPQLHQRLAGTSPILIVQANRVSNSTWISSNHAPFGVDQKVCLFD